MTKTIKAVCRSCDGSGLYQGFAEPKDTAVVCITCGGSGCEEIHYTPFKERKSKRGVKWVQWSGGTFVATGVGPQGKGRITYREFQQGRLPPKL
jgi:DnaJ-class molecular chaperone